MSDDDTVGDILFRERDSAHVNDTCWVPVHVSVHAALLSSCPQKGQTLLREGEHPLEVEREELRPCRVLNAQSAFRMPPILAALSCVEHRYTYRVVFNTVSPGRARIVHKDVEDLLLRAELLHEPVDLLELLHVRRDGYAFPGPERVQLLLRRRAVLGRARGYVHLMLRVGYSSCTRRGGQTYLRAVLHEPSRNLARLQHLIPRHHALRMYAPSSRRRGYRR